MQDGLPYDQMFSGMDAISSIDAAEWISAIDESKKYWTSFNQDCERITRRYKQEQSLQTSTTDKKRRFIHPILWSNTSVLMPAVYSTKPKPYVERRFFEKEPVSRVASQILERAMSVIVDDKDYYATVKKAVFDYILVGRGVIWMSLEESYEQFNSVDDFGMPVQYEEVGDQKVKMDYVLWQNFFCSPAPSWEYVTWVGRRHIMTKDELRDNYGEAGLAAYRNAVDMSKSKKNPSYDCEVYEIWDKASGMVIEVSPHNTKEPLRARPAPLKLKNFFPCPRPISANPTNDSLIPTADYKYYREFAETLDIILKKRKNIINTYAAKGLYNSADDSLKLLLSQDSDNMMQPVESWAQYMQNGGLGTALQLMDMSPFIQIENALSASQLEILNQIYDITGISDIVRGSSQGDVTATAERIKGQFATLRLQDKQETIANFVRDGLEIAAEIICGHFTDRNLAQYGGVQSMEPEDQQLFPMAVELLRSDKLRTIKLDIETSSTINMDINQEKAQRMEFLTSISGFITQMMPAVQQEPALGRLAGELIKFGAASFKAGRELEGVIDSTIDEMLNAAKQPKEAKPDPNEQIAQATLISAEADMLRAQTQEKELSIKSEKNVIEAEKVKIDAQEKGVKLDMEADKLLLKAAGY